MTRKNTQPEGVKKWGQFSPFTLFPDNWLFHQEHLKCERRELTPQVHPRQRVLDQTRYVQTAEYQEDVERRVRDTAMSVYTDYLERTGGDDPRDKDHRKAVICDIAQERNMSVYTVNLHLSHAKREIHTKTFG